MKRILDHFDRAYIINLRDRTDRRRGAQEQFHKFGIEVPNDKVRFLTAERPDSPAGFPSAGARGSFTSHRSVLELAIQDGLKKVLVFEDDVLFLEVDEGAISNTVAALARTSWDLVYFGYYLRDEGAAGALAAPLAPWTGDTIGGHFYAVNGDFIRTMYQFMVDCENRQPGDPAGGPTYRDGAYNLVRRLNPTIKTFLGVPSLARQRSSRTDLHPLKFYDRWQWAHPAVAAVRYLKNWARSSRRLG